MKIQILTEETQTPLIIQTTITKTTTISQETIITSRIILITKKNSHGTCKKEIHTVTEIIMDKIQIKDIIETKKTIKIDSIGKENKQIFKYRSKFNVLACYLIPIRKFNIMMIILTIDRNNDNI